MPYPPPLINGANYSFVDIQVFIVGNTIPLLGLLAIDYEKKQDKPNNYGSGTEPISYGTGKTEYPDGNIRIYSDELMALCAASPDGDILNIPPTSITIVYGGTGASSVAITTDIISNVRFLNNPMKNSAGQTLIPCDIKFSWAGLKRIVA